MANPVTGDSFQDGTPAIFGWHHTKGVAVSGKSEGKAGLFEGDVEVRGKIVAQDVQLTGAQPGAPGLLEQIADLNNRISALTRNMQKLQSELAKIKITDVRGFTQSAGATSNDRSSVAPV